MKKRGQNSRSYVEAVEQALETLEGFRLMPEWLNENRRPVIHKETVYRHVRGPDNSFYALVPRNGVPIMHHIQVGLSGGGPLALQNTLEYLHYVMNAFDSKNIPHRNVKGLDDAFRLVAKRFL